MKYFFTLFILFLFSCIGDDIIDDYVEPQIRITNPIDTIAVGEEYIFLEKYFNNIGIEENIDPIWFSSNSEVLRMDSTGKATAIMIGTSSVKVTYKDAVDSTNILVTEDSNNNTTNLREGTIKSTSNYLLEGSFHLMSDGNGNLVLTFLEDFQTTSALPGLYVYAGNNDKDISNALEIDKIKQFSGEHSYTIKGAEIFDFQYILFWCKPFNVKVGEGNFE